MLDLDGTFVSFPNCEILLFLSKSMYHVLLKRRPKKEKRKAGTATAQTWKNQGKCGLHHHWPDLHQVVCASLLLHSPHFKQQWTNLALGPSGYCVWHVPFGATQCQSWARHAFWWINSHNRTETHALSVWYITDTMLNIAELHCLISTW